MLKKASRTAVRTGVLVAASLVVATLINESKVLRGPALIAAADAVPASAAPFAAGIAQPYFHAQFPNRGRGTDTDDSPTF